MKLLKRLSWKWALAATILAIPLVFGWLYLFVDGPPVDDSDLAFEPRSIRPEDNGWPILAGRIDAAYWPNYGEDEEEGESRRERAGRMLVEGIFDPELTREILERNAEVLEAYERTWEMPELSGSAIDFTKLRTLWDTASLRALYLESRGESERAVQEAMQMLRQARKLRAGARVDMELLLAMGLEGVAIETFQKLLRNDRGQASRWSSLAKEILSGAASTKEDGRLVRALYQDKAEYIRGRKAGRYPYRGHSWTLVPRLWRAEIFLLPQQTMSLLAEASRTALRNVSRPGKDREPIAVPPCVHEGLGGWLRLLPVRNGIGKYLVKDHIDVTRQSQSRMLLARLQGLFLGARIAVEVHRAEHGRLPASLAELVPSRLDAVPIDPYDGEPIRYSAEKGMIWSVGSDCIDAGGSTAQSWQDALKHDAEPTLRIEG